MRKFLTTKNKVALAPSSWMSCGSEWKRWTHKWGVV